MTPFSKFLQLAGFTLVCYGLSGSANANMYVMAANMHQQLSSYTLDCGHWYVGGNIGVSHLYDKRTPGTTNFVNQNGPGWSAVGGYQFNSFLGAELGYTQYHASRETFRNFNIATTEHYAVHLAATGRLPIAYSWSLLGKLGAAYSYANKIYTAGGAAGAGSSVSLYGGLGFAYSVTPRVDLIAQWAAARGNKTTGSSSLYSLGATFAIV